MAKPGKDKVGASATAAESATAGAVSNDAANNATAAGSAAASDEVASKDAASTDAADEAAQDAQPQDAQDADADAAASESELVAKAQAETAEWKDKYLRLHAEWDTYRRRTAEQRAEEKLRATEKLVESLVPVLDDFERTIDYAQNNGETGLLSGVEAVHTKLVDTLVKNGVEVINPKGEAFDALVAQAVGTVNDLTVPDETVADVYQKGYRMGKKVIRAAMVTVATGGPKRETPAESEEDEQEAE